MRAHEYSNVGTYSYNMLLSLDDSEYEALDVSMALAQRLLLNHPEDACPAEAEMAVELQTLRENLNFAWRCARLVRARNRKEVIPSAGTDAIQRE